MRPDEPMIRLFPGGGGTFGVVLEATVLASPVVKVQTFILSFPTPNVTRTTEIWSILAQNGLRWADDGWGGYSNAGAVILINPVLSPQDAARSLAPLIEYGKGVKAETVESVLLVTEFPTFGAFINLFTSRFVAVRLFYSLSRFFGLIFQSVLFSSR